MINLIKKSLCGGIFIALAQLLYVNLLNYNIPNIIASAFFSLGLISILITNSYLYTGKIGYIKHFSDVFELLAILIWNFIGCEIILILYPNPINNDSILLFLNRVTASPKDIFMRGIICGIFIYLAVYFYKQKGVIPVIFAVMGFILCGSEHCIADFAYLMLIKTSFTKEVIYFIILVILGNSLGSIIMHHLLNCKELDKKCK